MEADNVSVSKFRTYKNVIVLSSGFLFLFTAFQALQNLQSSMRSDPHLGLASLAIVYASIVTSAMFIPPIAISKLGCKTTMMVAVSGYLIYISANFYPTWWTLIPASIILGFGGAPLWASKCAYITTSGIRYARHANIPEDHVITSFFGIFFLIFQSGQIWGNLISSVVLKQSGGSLTNSSLHNTSLVCGARYCPSTVITVHSQQLSNSVIYTLLGIYLLFAFLAFLVITIFLDQIKVIGNTHSNGFCDLFIATIKHLRRRNMQLLVPLTIFSGLEQGFVFADFTKGFVTCTIGIEKVGLIMIVFGAVDATFSLSLSKIVKITGRVPMMFTSAAVNLTLLIVFSVLEPDKNSLYIYLIGAGFWGFSDAVWQTQVNAFYGVIFPNNQEAAFSNYRLWESLGFMISFAYANSLCVYVKLYILIIMLCIGITGYGIIEYRRAKKVKLEMASIKEKNIDKTVVANTAAV